MSKCTPGPWRAGPNGRVFAPNPQTVLVCRVGAYDDPDLLPYCRERWDDDTRLIAAAREMFDVLKAMTKGPLSLNELNELMSAAVDVVAKIEGETE